MGQQCAIMVRIYLNIRKYPAAIRHERPDLIGIQFA